MHRDLWTLGVLVSLALPAAAQKLPDLYHQMSFGDPPFLFERGWRALLDGRDLKGWHGEDTKPHDWQAVRGVRWRRIFAPSLFEFTPQPGDRIVNGKLGKTANLETDEKFGDMDLYVEFLLAKGSNSGVFLHGLYEVQIFDSWGFAGELHVGDCGGIYEGPNGMHGAPPLHNAAMPPGQWQSMRIWFRAPRFDAAGRKTENARVLRVMLNGIQVQENVELTGPTGGHGANRKEAPENSLMLQGDHSAIAFRNIYIKTTRQP